MTDIPYGRQQICDDDIAAVSAALKAPFLTQGGSVAEFERALAARVGARFAVAVNSGTAALHAAYHAAGVASGRSILTSPITFVATANASRYLGGGVRFADVDPDSVLLDPAACDANPADDIGVVVPVHLTGAVSRMEDIAAIAARRGWVVIEDAAHALGASYTAGSREHQVGACAHSKMCCFSFHPVKHITTGEGGAITTNDAMLYRRLLQFRTHGITRDPALMHRHEGPWYYEQQELGFNYRITDFQCALGSSQLQKLDSWVARRRAIARRYDAAFADMPGVRVVASPAGSRGAYHIYVVRVDPKRRLSVFNALRAAGIGVNVHYIPVHLQPYYESLGFRRGQFPMAERYYSEAITLPIFPGLTDAEVDRVVDSVAASVGAASQRG